jgi:transcriptional regulator with XRE-family HTH domain
MKAMEEVSVQVVRDCFERECYECKRSMIGRRENYQYTEVGLRSVTLTNVMVFHCKCGAILAELPAVGQLHFAIAFDLLRKATILSGEEARYMRKWVGYSATELAEATGYSKSIISRWENGKQNITKESDRLLRLVVFAKMLENAVGQSISVNGKGLPNKVAEVGRLVKSLNIAALLRKVEDRNEGSMPLRIDPASHEGLAVQ